MSKAHYRPLGLRRVGNGESRGDADNGVVLGIDFGSTNMVVAAMQDGDVEVLANDIGARTTPSCVHVQVDDNASPAKGSPSPRKTWEERQTGEAALRLAVTDPDRTIRNVKRVLGRQYETVCVDPGKPLLGPVKLAAGRRGATRIRLGNNTTDQTFLSPEEIVGTLLREAKKTAETHLNRGEIRQAVISVPAFFNVAQRQALIDAASLAGLKVSRLVNETTAAALAYAHDREGVKVVVVVDIGGGGGSVSVARVDNNGVKVVTTSAKRLPGGEDFDKRMVTHLRKVIKEKHSKDIEDHRSLEILRSCWEKAKQKLSRIPHVDITTYLPAIDQELNITMPRSVFEAECKDLFELILEEVRTILSKSLEILEEDSADVFDHVVLVGGSSRIPRLRAEISDLLPGKLLKALNPDEAVARGAALLAAKAVRVEREVLVLTTQITFNQTSFTVKPCFVLDPQRRMVRPLPSRLDSKVMQYFKAEQADPQGTGEMVTIYESEAGPFKLYFNLSGLMVCLDLLGDQMFLTPPYCLDKPRLTQLTQKMERQISGEKVELDRAQAKNSLENFLREELGREVIQDEWQEQDELLRNRCQGILDEISQDANLSQVRANELLSAVTAQRKEIEKPRQIAMMEVRKAELRESLAKLLEGLLQEEAAPDTVGLRAAWTKEDEWLKGPGQEANLADLQTHLAEVERGKEELDAAREARRQEAKQKLVKFVEAFSRSLQDVDAELCSSSGDLEQNVKFFNGKCKEASEWLERHPNSMETDYDSQQKHVAGFRKAWNLVARSHFKIALDTKLKEALNLCPQEEWSTRYLEKFLSMKAWLESESESALLSEFRSKWVTLQQEAALLKKDLNQKTSDLRDKLRKKLDMCLNTKVSKETLCHPQALEFEQYCRELQKRVENNPTVAQQTLSDLYTELNKRSLDLRRSQSLARKMQLRKALSKLVRAIQAKQINQQDIARDLEEGLLNICTKNYLPILVNEKSSIDEIQSCLDEASHKDAEIRNERMSRNVARDLLQSVLTFVVEKHGGSELATPHLQWLQSYPAFPAEEFDKRRHQFLAALADAGQLVDIPQTPPRLEASTGRSSIGTAMEVKSDPVPMDFDETSEESAKVFHTMKATRGSWLHDEAVTALMSAMWGRAVENTAPRGWEAMPATGLPPSVLSHQLEVLQALATALALQTLREVKEAGPMSLLVDTQQNESRGLISLGIRFVDGRGRPVERLLVVREQQVSTDDGAELLQAFLSLCNQADYACWKDNLTGVSAEATGPAGKTFIRHLNEIVHGDSPETQSTVPELVNAGLPLEKRVAAACYDRLRQDETFQVAVEFFSTIDSLRFLFAATSQNFPLLRKACASLQPGEDPWRSYATAIRFVTAERDGVAEALRDLVDARPSLYQMVAALTHALSPSRDDEDSFTVCLAAFRSVFGSADTFFKHVGFPGGFQLERTHLLREHPFASVQDVMKALLTPIRNLLTKREWTLERQKDLESVVLTCVVVTVNEVHRARDQLLFVADALNQPLSEAAPQAAVFGGAEFAAEIEQLNAELRDHEYATLAGALAGSHLTQPELRQHFPRVFDVASRALAAPLLPPDGPRSSDMLQRACLLTAGCPADRVGHYAMLVAYPYPEHKPTLEEAFRILAETESSRLQQDAC